MSRTHRAREQGGSDDFGAPTLDPIEIATWRITAEQSAAEAALYHSALMERLLEETRRLALVVGSGRQKASVRALSVPNKVWPTPEHVWYARKRMKEDLAGASDLNAAIRLLETVERGEIPPPLRFIRRTNKAAWVLYGVERVSRDLRARGRGEVSVRLRVRNDGKACILIEEALVMLRSVWPEAADEHQRLVRSIVLLVGTGLQSASVPFTFGAVYLCPRSTWTASHYLDLLVHEGGHHALTVKTALVTLVTNPQAAAYSPLRREARPVMAVLHATFVLARIVHVLSRVRDEVPSSERDNVAKLASERAAELRRGIDSLAETACWTAEGERLFQQLCLALQAACD